jgi:ABC-type dipeptide/oligopeptide/nickel transport system ATPase component
MNNLLDTDDKSIDSKNLKFLEKLIDKAIKRLEDDSFKPKIQDALKAIQLKEKAAKTSEAEKIFWDEIEAIRQEELPELYPEETISLESQIQNTILGLKDQVKNGTLPVKIITDTFNQSKSKESQLTYHRIGRLLSTIGFRKAKTHDNTYAILWDDNLLSQNGLSGVEKDEKQLSASSPSPVVVLPAAQVRGWGPS